MLRLFSRAISILLLSQSVISNENSTAVGFHELPSPYCPPHPTPALYSSDSSVDRPLRKNLNRI